MWTRSSHKIFLSIPKNLIYAQRQPQWIPQRRHSQHLHPLPNPSNRMSQALIAREVEGCRGRRWVMSNRIGHVRLARGRGTQVRLGTYVVRVTGRRSHRRWKVYISLTLGPRRSRFCWYGIVLFWHLGWLTTRLLLQISLCRSWIRRRDWVGDGH